MIPSNVPLLNLSFEIVEQPTKTYRMDLTAEEHIRGYADGLEAMRQAVFKILNTERYQYIIYSWNYGIELMDLFGMPLSYVCPELERRITEALIQDGRITGVTDFCFESSRGGVLRAAFTVHTVFGDFTAEKEINY